MDERLYDWFMKHQVPMEAVMELGMIVEQIIVRAYKKGYSNGRGEDVISDDTVVKGGDASNG